MAAVYVITNQVNQKVYYGKAANPLARWYQHKWKALHKGSLILYRAMRKYGLEAFTFTVLATYESDAEACAHEIKLIAETPAKRRYNIAKGGNGGLTLTPDQIEQQWTIKSKCHEEFRSLFSLGWSAKRLGTHFGVSERAAQRCALRLGLSVQDRQKLGLLIRSPRPKVTKPKVVKPRVTKQKVRKFASPQEYSEFRAAVARKSNVARGPTPEVKAEILRLYLIEHIPARQIAMTLGVSHGSVRGLLNRTYAEVSDTERHNLKKMHRK